jgi:hypothetical protein
MTKKKDVQDDSTVELEISDSTYDLAHWTNRSYISSAVRAQVEKADIVILPRDLGAPVFPGCTTELFTVLKERVREDFQVEICIDDEDYEEFAFHHNLVTIGAFFASSVALPLLLNVIYDFAKSKVRAFQSQQTQLEVEIFCANAEGIKKIKYKGPVDQFKTTVDAALGNGNRRQKK